MARSSLSSPTVIAYPSSYPDRIAAVAVVASALVRLINAMKPGYAREDEPGRNRAIRGIEVRAPGGTWHYAPVEHDVVRGTDEIRVRLMHGDRESRLCCDRPMERIARDLLRSAAKREEEDVNRAIAAADEKSRHDAATTIAAHYGAVAGYQEVIDAEQTDGHYRVQIDERNLSADQARVLLAALQAIGRIKPPEAADDDAAEAS